MTEVILVLNVGSSSIKFGCFEWSDTLPLHTQGRMVGIGAMPRLVVNGETVQTFAQGMQLSEALDTVLNWIRTQCQSLQIKVAVHRIVHGGPTLTAPTMLTPEVMDTLEALAPLAPLHQPYNLSAVRQLAHLYPDLAQVGCFDTAFHAKSVPLFHRYAIPKHFKDKGIRRYGFHGLSYEWIARFLEAKHPKLFEGRVVVAHLGNGASVCGMRGGVSIDSTMGMTPLEGLPMGTRCGNIDAGVILYMLRQLDLPLKQVEHILYHESGLKGLSGGISSDVVALLAAKDSAADFAIDFFAMAVAQQIARLVVSIGGVDAIVFAGGIGENAKSVRDRILGHLHFLGPVETLVVSVNEEEMMARHSYQLLTKN